jgi:hypothetical protein
MSSMKVLADARAPAFATHAGSEGTMGFSCLIARQLDARLGLAPV